VLLVEGSSGLRLLGTSVLVFIARNRSYMYLWMAAVLNLVVFSLTIGSQLKGFSKLYLVLIPKTSF